MRPKLPERPKVFCSSCEREITWNSKSGLCRGCNVANVSKLYIPRNDMPKYLKQRYYQLCKKQSWMKKVTIREFGELVKELYKDGDFVDVNETSIIVIRKELRQEVKV